MCISYMYNFKEKSLTQQNKMTGESEREREMKRC